jgi:hypothetical protein
VRNVVIKRVAPDFVKIDAGNDAMGWLRSIGCMLAMPLPKHAQAGEHQA